MKVLSSLVRLLLRWVDERNELYEVKVKKKKRKTQNQNMFKLATDPPAFLCTYSPIKPSQNFIVECDRKNWRKTMNVSQIIVVTLLEERKQKKIMTIDIWELYLSDNLLLMTTS